MKELKPPQPLPSTFDSYTVFLAGSIEMGAAMDWQTVIARSLTDLDVTILNPRREAWDASWPQDADFRPFREQVEWELEAQERADLIVFYFAPDTRAPITLLELGLAAARKRAAVCCPKGYWRKGNVDIICRRHDIPMVADLNDLIAHVRTVFSTS